jgi:hypothetical protein
MKSQTNKTLLHTEAPHKEDKIMTNKYIATKVINEELNGVELYFSVYPISGTKETLKKNGFRWNHKKGCWYAKQSLMTNEVAKVCAETTIGEYKNIAACTGEEVKEIQTKTETTKKATKKAAKKEVKTNKYGVKVGDFFSCSWGWEQTNVDFFQVIELVGTSSVRVREVSPKMIAEDAVSGMSADRTYDLSSKEILPPSPHSVFINDQEKGDLKRLKSWAADGISNPQFYLTSYANAYYCTGNTEKHYESWYA